MRGTTTTGETEMQTIRVLKKTESDGTLSLRIPLGKPETEYEVVIVVHPKASAAHVQTAEERGWPAGYFEKTYGSIEDETFFRHPQGEMSKPVEFE
jgi:hypothetical protein